MKFLPNTIINFHVVHDSKWMDKTLRMLNRIYKMVSIEDIEDYYYKGKNLKNACHITFDDGDVSFYHTVFPLLKKYNIPTSIYVSPLAAIKGTNFWFQEIRDYDMNRFENIVRKLVCENEENDDSIIFLPIKSLLKNLPQHIIWEAIYAYQKQTKTSPKKGMNLNHNQLLELHNSGLVTIGAHTLNHPILKNESDEIAFMEITKSITELAELLNKEIHYFAYPNGVPHLDFGKREIDILSKTTIKLAFSTEKNKISKNDDLFSVPRNGITKGSKSFIFFKLLSGNKWEDLKRLTKGRQESNFRKTLNKSTSDIG